MIYSEKTAIGDAGEFFFAYQIAYVLKWPCRLFDIDIGIDAQVEVIDAKQRSTGRFVGFQVKARSLPDEVNAKYVTEAQLLYWKSSDVPVFVVLVHLPTRNMYLHRVSKDFQYPRATAAGLVRIAFDLDKDYFSDASRTLIAEAGDQQVLAELEKLLRPVQDEAEKIEAAIRNEYLDVEFFITRVRLSEFFEDALSKATALVESHQVGSSELNSASTHFKRALRALYEFLVENEFAVDHPTGGLIQEFINNFR